MACSWPLLLFAATAGWGCSKGKQPSSAGAGAGQGTVQMTVKVFENKKAWVLLSESPRPIRTTGVVEPRAESKDKSMGHNWSQTSAYRIEYHWPKLVLEGKTPVAPGVYLKAHLTRDRCWPYEVAHVPQARKCVVLKGGVVAHVYDVKDPANRDEVLATAQEWTDWDVTVRAREFVRDMKVAQSKNTAR